MITFLVILVAIACAAPLWLIFDIADQLRYDKEGELAEDSIPFYQSMLSLVLGVITMCTLAFGSAVMYNMSIPDINTAHQLKNLKHEQIYKVLQKFEHHWRTYYYVEHANGHGGLYWCKTGDFDLDIGYYKLEYKRHNSEKMKFTPLTGLRMNYCAT